MRSPWLLILALAAVALLLLRRAADKKADGAAASDGNVRIGGIVVKPEVFGYKLPGA